MRPGIPLGGAFERDLTYQTYPAPTPLMGVHVVPLTKHRDDQGWFLEYLRTSGGNVDGLPCAFEVRQISMSHAAPRRINAFHLHPRSGQNELWTAIAGQLLVWLVDCRAHSPTQGVRQRVLLSAEEPALLYIPAGVAHGYKAGHEGALLCYAADRQFDRVDPDEGRLPWDYFGGDLWDDDRG